MLLNYLKSLKNDEKRKEKSRSRRRSCILILKKIVTRRLESENAIATTHIASLKNLWCWRMRRWQNGARNEKFRFCRAFTTSQAMKECKFSKIFLEKIAKNLKKFFQNISLNISKNSMKVRGITRLD